MRAVVCRRVNNVRNSFCWRALSCLIRCRTFSTGGQRAPFSQIPRGAQTSMRRSSSQHKQPSTALFLFSTFSLKVGRFALCLPMTQVVIHSHVFQASQRPYIVRTTRVVPQLQSIVRVSLLAKQRHRIQSSTQRPEQQDWPVL